MRRTNRLIRTVVASILGVFIIVLSYQQVLILLPEKQQNTIAKEAAITKVDNYLAPLPTSEPEVLASTNEVVRGSKYRNLKECSSVINGCKDVFPSSLKNKTIFNNQVSIKKDNVSINGHTSITNSFAGGSEKGICTGGTLTTYAKLNITEPIKIPAIFVYGFDGSVFSFEGNEKRVTVDRDTYEDLSDNPEDILKKTNPFDKNNVEARTGTLYTLGAPAKNLGKDFYTAATIYGATKSPTEDPEEYGKKIVDKTEVYKNKPIVAWTASINYSTGKIGKNRPPKDFDKCGFGGSYNGATFYGFQSLKSDDPYAKTHNTGKATQLLYETQFKTPNEKLDGTTSSGIINKLDAGMAVVSETDELLELILNGPYTQSSQLKSLNSDTVSLSYRADKIQNELCTHNSDCPLIPMETTCGGEERDGLAFRLNYKLTINSIEMTMPDSQFAAKSGGDKNPTRVGTRAGYYISMLTGGDPGIQSILSKVLPQQLVLAAKEAGKVEVTDKCVGYLNDYVQKISDNGPTSPQYENLLSENEMERLKNYYGSYKGYKGSIVVMTRVKAKVDYCLAYQLGPGIFTKQILDKEEKIPVIFEIPVDHLYRNTNGKAPTNEEVKVLDQKIEQVLRESGIVPLKYSINCGKDGNINAKYEFSD